MDREILDEMNLTELLTCLEQAGQGILSRNVSRKRLYDLLLKDKQARPEELCGTVPTRAKVASFIDRYRDRAILPISVGGTPCSGDCRTYGCPAVIAIKCHRDMT